MKPRKSKRPQTVPKPKTSPPPVSFDEFEEKEEFVEEEPEAPTFTEIGGSPVPGFTLRHVLRGHKVKINNIAWSPDGSWLASAADDGTVRIWDPETGKQLHLLRHAKKGEQKYVFHVGVMSNGRTLVSGSRAGLRVWDALAGELVRNLEGYGPLVVPIPGGDQILTSQEAEAKARSVCLLSLPGGEAWRFPLSHLGYGPFATATPDGRFVIVTDDEAIQLLDVFSGAEVKTLHEHPAESVLSKIDKGVYTLAVSPQGDYLAAGSEDRRVYVYNLRSHRLERTLEGHTANVTGVAFSHDGRLLVSKGWKENVRLWDTQSWQELSVLYEGEGSTYVGVTPRFHPQQSNVLATFGEEQLAVRIWDLDLDAILRHGGLQPSVQYVTAKIVLTGDSGVGKTGLGWRLAHGEFKEQSST